MAESSLPAAAPPPGSADPGSANPGSANPDSANPDSGVGTESIRGVILAERGRVLDQMRMLDGDFAAIVEATTSVATDDEHDPEGATIAFERAQVLAMREQSAAHLAELDSALADLDSGAYGICARCGRRIPAERLAARPRSRHCIACASAAR